MMVEKITKFIKCFFGALVLFVIIVVGFGICQFFWTWTTSVLQSAFPAFKSIWLSYAAWIIAAVHAFIACASKKEDKEPEAEQQEVDA